MSKEIEDIKKNMKSMTEGAYELGVSRVAIAVLKYMDEKQLSSINFIEFDKIAREVQRKGMGPLV